MNVLQDYTNLTSIAHVITDGKDSLIVNNAYTTSKMIKREMDIDRSLIHEKAYYIVKHFRENKNKLGDEGFNPKAMVVVKNRKSILIYKQEIESIIKRLPENEVFLLTIT